MTELINKLCQIDATSGDEYSVRDFIVEQIKDYCEYTIDNLGNILCCKKGKNKAQKRVMVDAHMDEVGLIIKSITPDGFLRFETVGGIDTSVMISRKVKINNKVNGVIGVKPIHLCSDAERTKLPKCDSLYIDIGASSQKEAMEYVSIGDRAVMYSDFTLCDDKVISKALDDRLGCALLIDLIRNYDEYDFYGVFSTQEEVGARGAKVAAFSINPDSAIILEGTTAADIADVPTDKRVCTLGNGVVISFMDRGTVYDKEYFNLALNSGLTCQVKSAVAGGNNSGTVHLSGNGVRTIALSVPCRYIHSASSVADLRDVDCAKELARYLLGQIASGNAK